MNRNRKYNQLFDTAKAKAEAFDKIAEQFYDANFGTISKSDIDVLLFSIYIEQILEKEETNLNAYSDYTLSKELGITQSKVSTLKVKKQLLYPYEKFDWKASFARISQNAVYENNKIKIHIPDKNLYIELQNAIESNGGFIETQLNSHLLQIRPEYFLDLLIGISDDKDRDDLMKSIRKEFRKKDKNIEFFDKEPLGRVLKNKAPRFIAELLSVCIAHFTEPQKSVLQSISQVLNAALF